MTGLSPGLAANLDRICGDPADGLLDEALDLARELAVGLMFAEIKDDDGEPNLDLCYAADELFDILAGLIDMRDQAAS
jgi:hypothetical protein